MNIVEHLQSYIFDNIKIFKTFLSLIKLEARLASLSIYPLLLNFCMLLVIAMTAWISLMILLEYSFFLFLGNNLGAIFLITLINLSLFIILIRKIKFNLNNMSFEKTRTVFLKNRPSEKNESIQSIDPGNHNDAREINSSEK